jgi:RNA polymerase sigma-70 factor (ECF subfamily)
MTLSSDLVVASMPEAPLDDRALVQRAQRGNRAASEELARRFRQPAYLLALQLLGNPDDALDVAQDSMLSFFTTLDRFNDTRPVKPWLLTIVRNRARDLMRRRRVRKVVPLDSTGGQQDDQEAFRPQLVDDSADPEADARQSQLRRAVWSTLARLPEAQREILILRDYQDLSYSEIAKVLSIPIGTVMSRLHRARKSMRDLIDEELIAPLARRTP